MEMRTRIGIFAAAVLAFGAARLPYEAAVSRELRDARLSPPALDIGTSDKIGQTSAAVALGGLRTLVASFLNLRAFGFFEEKKWDHLADTYHLIVDLAPNTAYYWDSGAWNLAYNAASYYMGDSELPPLRRRQAWRESIQRGRAFLERGVRNNPREWTLSAALGQMLSDPLKLPAFEDRDQTLIAAAAAYRHAVETGHALAYVRRAEMMALARVKGRESEALALARTLYQEKSNRVPTLLALLVILEYHENPRLDTTARALELFGSPEKAYNTLGAIWQDTRSRFPVYGLAATLESLERMLAIPADRSILSEPPPPPIGPDTWFAR